jgi:hypothetical protein
MQADLSGRTRLVVGQVSSGKQIFEPDRQRRASQRAMSIRAFCETYNLGRTSTYAEIKAGRLKARKAGRRTVITADDAEHWLSCLPAMEKPAERKARQRLTTQADE